LEGVFRMVEPAAESDDIEVEDNKPDPDPDPELPVVAVTGGEDEVIMV
jgi:hypothetical protein